MEPLLLSAVEEIIELRKKADEMFNDVIRRLKIHNPDINIVDFFNTPRGVFFCEYRNGINLRAGHTGYAFDPETNKLKAK